MPHTDSDIQFSTKGAFPVTRQLWSNRSIQALSLTYGMAK